MIENLGFLAVVIMVVSYALEHRHPSLILVFSFGCALAAIYAWIIGSWPFFAAEGIWAIVALRRWYAVSKGMA